MSDQVPFSGSAAKLSDLVLGLLHFVLAENAAAGVDCLPDRRVRLRFTNSDELDLGGASSGAIRGCCNTSQYMLIIFGYGHADLRYDNRRKLTTGRGQSLEFRPVN